MYKSTIDYLLVVFLTISFTAVVVTLIWSSFKYEPTYYCVDKKQIPVATRSGWICETAALKVPIERK